MPYRKRNYKKKTKGRNWTGYLNTANKALQVALATKRLLNVEYKHRDRGEITLTPSTTWQVENLNHFGQGDTSSTRSGITVRMKSIQFKFLYQGSASATDVKYARIVVLLDRSPNSNTITNGSEVFESNTITTLRNNINASRFKVLLDRTIHTDPDTRQGGTFNYFKKINTVMKFAGSSSTDVETNDLHILYISDSAVNPPTFKYSYRMRFIDN